MEAVKLFVLLVVVEGRRSCDLGPSILERTIGEFTMKRVFRCLLPGFSLVFLLSFLPAEGQNGPAANSDPTYQELRRLTLSGEAYTVKDLVLKRDAAEFTFQSGKFYLVAPVNGKVTGAVFVGSGQFTLTPPIAAEAVALSRMTKQPAMTERFETAVLRFTDNTAAELKAAGSAGSGGNPGNALADSQEVFRKKLRYNLEARILQDVTSAVPGGLFVALIHGQNYSSKMLLTIDPHGAPEVAPEEISLLTFDDMKAGIWAAFHYANEYKTGAARGTERNATYRVELQKLNTSIDRSAYLRGKADTTIVSSVDGLRAIPLELFPTLRVKQVNNAQGQPLSFIQEDKDRDSDFWVLLPKPLAKGETFSFQTVYEGKDAVHNEGNGNYYPVARTSWYPSKGFGDYAQYEMTFAIPKQLKMIATGNLVKEYAEGDQDITVWKSEVPQAVAGFNFGRFKSDEVKLDKLGVTIQSFANVELPDWVKSLQMAVSGEDMGPSKTVSNAEGFGALGSISTISMMKKPLAEAQVAVELFTHYFGPMSYSRVSMTQQTACNFGQSWPTLVYLPICSFFDDTIKHQLGLGDTRGYWRVVAPHEVAHQWWGHTVGFASYRDQWMSEGFADFSAALFVQLVWKNPQEFIRFWKDERELITEKNKEGYRAIDVGPVTQGYRLNNTATGSVARRLIYPKGAYILHMIRMMMWDSKSGDNDFRAFMTDFVKTYSNQPASTEDFKAVLEKHMKPLMDMGGNGKMDWFFDQYVYGTALPKYTLTYSFEKTSSGVVLKFKASQSEVPDSFRMLVPLYIEWADGRVVQMGRVKIRGNASEEAQVNLGDLKAMPKRVVLNYNGDVLAAD